ncbi:MAG: TPM domain-containing protein, partial [Leptospirales bacterium]|nr:TPM domain-containing protein [Leptospirales bacterium]
LPTIGKIVPKEFAVALFNTWKIGKAKKNNGLLVLHILDQRRVEIETGYGMEGILPDVKCKWILDEVGIPFFKAGSFADGHYEIVRALLRGVNDPEISHKALVSGLELTPGETTQEIPKIPKHDPISLKHSESSFERLLYGGLLSPLLGLGGLGLYILSWIIYALFGIGRKPYFRYQLFEKAGFPFQYGAALLGSGSAFAFEYAHTDTFWSPAPVMIGLSFLVGWLRGKKLKALRDEPRICECGKTMRKLSESDDDSYLKKGNVVEENIRSMDYDVWVCECGKHSIEAYKGDAPADECDKCNFKTYQLKSSVVITAATTSSEGLRELTYLCANCGHGETVRQTIPKISTSSSSSSGGSSGGSFGGGSSGGGGAGSSY